MLYLIRFLKIGLLGSLVFNVISIYTISFTTIQGNIVSMQAYQGKKIAVVILPTANTPAHAAFLSKVDSVSIVYANQLTIIGVPSYNDGYTDADSTAFRLFCQSKFTSGNVVVAKGMYTRKTSGGLQHALFSWLTKKENNGHFNIDAQGIRHMFFIKEQGEISGVFPPGTPFSQRMLNHIMQ